MEDLSCPLCFEQFSRSSEILTPRIFKCGHVFCTGCIDKLIKIRNKTCPLCRLEFRYSKASKTPIVWSLLNLSEKDCTECISKSDLCGICPDCNKWICKLCKEIHLQSIREKAQVRYQESHFNLEILLKKVTVHIYYENLILEEINSLKEELFDDPKVKQSINEEFDKLRKEREEKLKEYILEKDKITEKINIIANDREEIKKSDSFVELRQFNENLSKHDILNNLRLDLINKDIGSTCPIYKIHELINFSKLSVNKFSFEEKYSVFDICDAIRGDLKNTKLIISIAVVGSGKSGKSEFINTLRGLKSNDSQTAQAKTTECTSEPMRYDYEYGDYKIVLWDFPGFGTSHHLQNEYLNFLRSLNCHAYIYLYKGAFGEHDEIMIKQIIKYFHKKVFIVRTHADEDYKQDFCNDLIENEYDNRVLNECRANFESERNKNLFLSNFENIYYISCKMNWEHIFDFEKLVDDIKRCLPQIRRELILSASSAKMNNLLNEKRKFFEDRIEKLSSEAAWSCLIPLTSINSFEKVIYGEIEHYLEKFDVNKETLELLGINEKLINIWNDVYNIDLSIFEINSDKLPKITLKSIALSALMYVPAGIGALFAWPINNILAKQYLKLQLNNIYKISRARMDKIFEIIEHEADNS